MEVLLVKKRRLWHLTITVHKYPAYEQCNTDDAKSKSRVTIADDSNIMAIGHPCKHCWD